MDADDFNIINKFGEENGCKNMSQAMGLIIREWRRFKFIALEMQKKQTEEAEKKVLKDMKKAKVIKNENKNVK